MTHRGPDRSTQRKTAQQDSLKDQVYENREKPRLLGNRRENKEIRKTQPRTRGGSLACSRSPFRLGDQSISFKERSEMGQ
jgi:hypothetical protein